ncbi:hypothetical protein ACA910_013166 [Epithemia clementina (nom. ined.)]
MGGDGGVIPKNRRYLRGAGASDKTGNDASGSHDRNGATDPAVVKEEQARAMKICAISNQPLVLSDASKGEESVVVCPYGRLYNREAVVEALLEQKIKKTKDPRLDHIRGLKDLHSVRFHLGRSSSQANDRGGGGGNDDGALVQMCPVRGTELNGQIPAVVLVPGSPGLPNVVSARAIQEMGKEAIEQVYGPAKQSIKLLPSGEELKAIKLEQQAIIMAADSKKRNGGSKKRKELLQHEMVESPNKTIKKKETADGPSNKESCQLHTKPQSKILTSIFTQPTTLSEKEKANNLFARTG